MTVSKRKKKSTRPLSLWAGAQKLVGLPQTCDPWITWTTLALLLFGSLMVVSTKQGTITGGVMTIAMELAKQGLMVVIAWVMGMMVFANLSSYKFFSKWLKFAGVVYIALIFYVAFAGQEIGGARAWIYIGPLSVQPSEFGKPLEIIFFSTAIYQATSDRKRQKSLWTLYSGAFVFTLFNLAGLAFQKDIGSCLITFGIALVCALIPSYPCVRKLRRWALVLVCLFAFVILVTVYWTDLWKGFESVPFLSHIATRVENMKDPYADYYGGGFQPANALYGIADAGFFGKGLGSSIRKYGFLTQAESDYILAIVIEETGIFGLLGVTAGYAIIGAHLLKWALRSDRLSDKVLFTGTTTYLALHYFVNVGGVSMLIPMTGVPLLLISAGGSSILAVGIALGLCQSRISALKRKEMGLPVVEGWARFKKEKKKKGLSSGKLAGGEA